jgi:hypothetical protein
MLDGRFGRQVLVWVLVINLAIDIVVISTKTLRKYNDRAGSQLLIGMVAAALLMLQVATALELSGHME